MNKNEYLMGEVVFLFGWLKIVMAMRMLEENEKEKEDGGEDGRRRMKEGPREEEDGIMQSLRT